MANTGKMSLYGTADKWVQKESVSITVNEVKAYVKEGSNYQIPKVTINTDLSPAIVETSSSKGKEV